MFLSRQRADLKDLGCPRGQETQRNRENDVFKESVSVVPPWLLLDSPELSWARPGFSGCSVALACSGAAPGLLLAAPTTEPQEQPSDDTQHGKLRPNPALHNEFSEQPGLNQQMLLT